MFDVPWTNFRLNFPRMPLDSHDVRFSDLKRTFHKMKEKMAKIWGKPNLHPETRAILVKKM